MDDLEFLKIVKGMSLEELETKHPFIVKLSEVISAKKNEPTPKK
ncbi:Uncharacterised protein [uncultured archaeon]|nr:Uncharacterised protein [uncultured archaeon]